MSDIAIINQNTDADGRAWTRNAIAVAGASMYFAGPAFIAAKADSNVWQKINPQPPFTLTDRGFSSVTLYKPDGTTTAVETEVGFTVVDISLDRNVEIIGGQFDVAASLPVGNGDSDWRIWAIAAPNIPAVYGGQIPFAEDIQLNHFKEGKTIVMDGRVPKMMPFAVQGLPNGEANRFRFIVKHPTGLNPSVNGADVARFQVNFENYVIWP